MEKYQAPEMEVTIFDENDVIVTSGNPDELPDDEWDD